MRLTEMQPVLDLACRASLISVLIFCPPGSLGESQNAPAVQKGHLIVTKLEAQNILKLRSNVLPKIPKSSLIHNYSTDDLYLFRWLQAASNDLNLAEKQMIQHAKWREVVRVDTIDEENWDWFRTEYVVVEGNHDKEGRPLTEMWLSEWNVRKAIIAGMERQLTRWITRMVEIQQRQLYDARSRGQNVTQALLLVDMERFNMVTNGCPRCLNVYRYWGWTWENNYPNLYQTVYLINATPVFRAVLTGMQSFMKPSTRQSVKSYMDRRAWQPKLDSGIERSQRSSRFGGTLRRDMNR